MKKTLSLILTLAMVLSLVACGSQTATTPAPETSDLTENSSRTDLNLCITTAWTTSDPIASKNVQDRLVFWNMSDCLLNLNESTGEVEPRIAESYSTSADGLTWTFNLRKDVKFHNGDGLTANDVVFSIKRAMDTGISRVTEYVMNIADVVAKDDYTVDIILTAPYSPLLVNLCNLPIISEKVVAAQGADFGTKVHDACCGAYKLATMEVDSKIVLEAFEDYYRGAPSIKTITYHVITDSAAAMVAFESGDLDWYNCSATDYARLQGDPRFCFESLAANHITFFAINGGSKNAPALQNKLVRQAIFYAIDRDELNYAAFDGIATSTPYLMIPEMNYAFPTNGVDAYEKNIDKAKALLAEAGYPDGVDCGKLLCFTGTYFETVATMIQAQLEKVGIRFELEWNEQATVLARGREQDYDAYVCGSTWSGDGGRFGNAWACIIPEQNIYYGPDYDIDWMLEICGKGDSAADVNERMGYYTEALNYFSDYAEMYPIFAKAVPIVYDKNLVPHNYATNQQVFEWYWN